MGSTVGGAAEGASIKGIVERADGTDDEPVRSVDEMIQSERKPRVSGDGEEKGGQDEGSFGNIEVV